VGQNQVNNHFDYHFVEDLQLVIGSKLLKNHFLIVRTRFWHIWKIPIVRFRILFQISFRRVQEVGDVIKPVKVRAQLVLALISEQQLNQAAAEIASPPGGRRVAEKRQILVGLERVRLGKAQLEDKSDKAEDEEGGEQDGTGEDREQESFLLGDHLHVGLSPFLQDGLALPI
jgi:hypothetical protein